MESNQTVSPAVKREAHLGFTWHVGDHGDEDPTDNIVLDIDGEELIFTDDKFPSLPDFPCLSSPSPSPSNPCLSSSGSSSSSSSWTLNNGDLGPLGDTEGLDILDDIDLLDLSDPFDTSSLFSDENTVTMSEVSPAPMDQITKEDPTAEDGGLFGGLAAEGPSEDLAKIFLEWLKSNKDSISPEDLRSIKLKRSTIECAVRRLGGGKQGRVHLLKLILSWVQNNHLQKKRRRNRQQQNEPLPPLQQCNAWVPYQEVNPMMTYAGAAMPYHFPNSNQTFSASPDLMHGVDPSAATAWGAPINYSMVAPYPAFPAPGNPFPGAMYPGQQMYQQGQPFPVPASATKEARKKRMARQRRFSTHHHHGHHGMGYYQHPQQQVPLPSINIAAEASAKAATLYPAPQPPSATTNAALLSAPVKPLAMQEVALPTPLGAQKQQLNMQHVSSSSSSGRRQGLKAEKNLRFLLQKVLKHTDVSSLGRIVLPKKEAETHLPELDARDGISLAMEDIGTSRVWNMRYRFWPNNKSRMYLLENTGDFIRSNGLREGDFIVIYSDIKCGKYMIRGVKVRQPPESKRVAVRSKKAVVHTKKAGVSGKSKLANKCDHGCEDDPTYQILLPYPIGDYEDDASMTNMEASA